jgi:hypothetical protein
VSVNRSGTPPGRSERSTPIAHLVNSEQQPNRQARDVAEKGGNTSGNASTLRYGHGMICRRSDFPERSDNLQRLNCYVNANTIVTFQDEHASFRGIYRSQEYPFTCLSPVIFHALYIFGNAVTRGERRRRVSSRGLAYVSG